MAEYRRTGDRDKIVVPFVRMQIKNPYVWLLAAAAICLGISRYSISSWGVIFLQEAKGLDLVTAGSIMSLSPILGGVGSFLSGIISDKIFK